MIKSAFLACAILAPLPLIAAQPLGLPLVGDESSSSPFGGGIGGTDSEPHGTNGGWIGQPGMHSLAVSAWCSPLMRFCETVSRRSTTSKRQLEFAALDGNSAPVANELVHDNNMAASLGGTIAGLDASSDKTGPPPPAKRHLAPRGALISVSGNSVPVANDVMRNNNAAADVLGDITQLDVGLLAA